MQHVHVYIPDSDLELQLPRVRYFSATFLGHYTPRLLRIGYHILNDYKSRHL